MDQGWANVLAAVILLAGGTFLGGYIEARRSDDRAKTERTWQAQQQKEQSDQEDARRREQWTREDGLAQRARVREALIRDLHCTREQCLATLNLSVFQAMGGVDVAAQREVMGEKYSNADVCLIGDKASVGLYLSVLGKLTTHQPGTPLGDELISACADASSAVKQRIREQESRVNRDERLHYVTALAMAGMPSDARNSPLLLGMLGKPGAPVEWGHNPDE